MTLITTIDIEEIPTEVMVDFASYFGEIEVNKITSIETGDALGLEITDKLYWELHEAAADMMADNGIFWKIRWTLNK